MPYIIENNNFTKDIYGVRLKRLSSISKCIDDFYVEVNLPEQLYQWCKEAFESFMDLYANQTGLKSKSVHLNQLFKASYKLLHTKYKFLKNILIVNYHKTPEEIEQYGLNGAIPRTQEELIKKVHQMVNTNRINLQRNDPRAIPEKIIDSLYILCCDTEKRFQNLNEHNSNNRNQTLTLRRQYNIDSVNLRNIYNWFCAYWGDKDQRLKELGFYVDKAIIDEPHEIQLSYDMMRKEFNWNQADWAKSYQLEYTINDKDWQIAYYGTECKVPYFPSKGIAKFRVRAKNGNGFTKWSDPIEVAPGL